MTTGPRTPDDPTRLPIADAPATRRAIWNLLAHDRRAMAVVITLTGLAAAAGLATPRLVGAIVDRIEAGTDTTTLDLLGVALLGFAIAQFLLNRFARYAAHRFGERILARLREQFVQRTLALPTDVVEKAGPGDLLTRSSADVDTVGATLRDVGPGVVLAVAQILFVLAAIALLDPLLGLCVFAATPALLLIMRWYLRRARTAYLAEGAANSTMAEALAATADGAATVESFRLQNQRIDEGNRQVATVYNARKRTLFLRSVLFPVMDFSYGIPLAVVLLIGGLRHVEGAIGLGTVIAASLYVLQLSDPLDELLEHMEFLQRSTAALARIEGVGAVTESPRPHRTAAPTDDSIDVVAVRHAYRDDHDVLHDVDLTVRPGERLALVGPSGAGKSTLGRLLAGIDAPRAGSITVGGVPIAELTPDERRRRVLLVTQEHHVFLGTLRDNLAIAAPHADDDTLYAALHAIDAHWATELPAGLDTEVNTTALRLDAAQSQQIALARVILADPNTVILDEATAMLDPTTARHAERALAAVLEGRTVIAIAHRLHTAHDADRVAVLEAGSITELGDHDTLLAADGAYAALWRSWHGVAGTTEISSAPILTSTRHELSG
ncbi:ABC transporter ATP-binding protein [Actinoalloteichus hymeniacidonis]|uniref:ABC-type multidrug transport system, ATPase and permease component n=1 Tax=Actinoalloteichus hymeniacidonis TaxID=340345 RepID=A0AAC9HQY0_9PSEU|nr:ABC transporter ATP-binding protein [Actinoalloteichus hymeniacidonis]AOS63611.1 ABC-type multidrug transport system, ATPase and permease component [Actinoalloteichus hymeniacidonis]MBB5908341.1 ATP-binding cassette subfamily C protein [Actinoalloteichus hymeniacidonis]